MRLSDRQLNRATLARQLLLERVGLAPAAAVEHLAHLAQYGTNPVCKKGQLQY